MLGVADLRLRLLQIRLKRVETLAANYTVAQLRCDGLLSQIRGPPCAFLQGHGDDRHRLA